jgi:hypothetical protein
MALSALFRKLGEQHGIEIDDEELAGLGLSDDEDESTPPAAGDIFDFSAPLPGRASGMVELSIDADCFGSAAEIPSKDGLMWFPIIRSGQWAVRPGTQGSKKRVPLKVVAGHSKNQRREIGLQDLLDAHNDEAIQHVTVPSSHNNSVLENQGFVDKMQLVDGEVKDQKTKQMTKVKVLLGGYRITEPDTKGKMTRGTIANRSAGILYDYTNTETGKTYPAVVEHVALTNKPWITGMISFGRPLSEAKISTVGLSLSNDQVDDDEYALVLSQELELSGEDQDFLAVAGATWDHETSPNWLQQQVNSLLEDARRKKLEAKRLAQPKGSYLDYDFPPNYRCREAKPGSALISDGWGDDANYWVAPITVKDGVVELSDFDTWTASKKAYVPDDRPKPAADKLPLEHSTSEPEQPIKLSRLEMAQAARRMRARPEQDPTTTPREVVGTMAGDGTLILSEEAQAAIQAAEAKAAAAEARAEKLSERVERLTGTVNGGEVDKFIAHLKAPQDKDGLGLSEELGHSGALKVIRDLMLADDGEPAVQGEVFSTDANKEGELTLSDAIRSIFAAFKKGQEGKTALGETLGQPADEETVELDADGKPVKKDDEATTKLTIPAGKPGEGGESKTEDLSVEERSKLILSESPTGALAAVLGRRPGAPTTTTPTGGDA